MLPIRRLKLSVKETTKAIANRTGFPETMVRGVIEAYSEIVKEAVLAQVEVPFGSVGTFTWRQVAPRENARVWDYSTMSYKENVDLEGYQKMAFKPGKKWAQVLRKKTSFTIGEENPAIDGKLRYNDEDKMEKEEENDELQTDDADE